MPSLSSLSKKITAHLAAAVEREDVVRVTYQHYVHEREFADEDFRERFMEHMYKQFLFDIQKRGMAMIARLPVTYLVEDALHGVLAKGLQEGDERTPDRFTPVPPERWPPQAAMVHIRVTGYAIPLLELEHESRTPLEREDRS